MGRGEKKAGFVLILSILFLDMDMMYSVFLTLLTNKCAKGFFLVKLGHPETSLSYPCETATRDFQINLTHVGKEHAEQGIFPHYILFILIHF